MTTRQSARHATSTVLVAFALLLLPASALAADSDGDGVDDAFDNCPSVYNPGQEDWDFDGIGDACDDDVDGDFVPNSLDNCPLVFNQDQADHDGDGDGDACDPDDDNDGIPDYDDACPFFASAVDADRDGAPDGCDPRDDRFWRFDGKTVQVAAGAGRRNQAIVSDGAGGAVVVWLDSSVGLEAQRLGANGAPLWGGSGIAVTASAVNIQRAAAVPDGSGGAVVAWADQELFVSRINGAGTLLWTTQLTTGTGAAFFTIATDDAGGAYVGWSDGSLRLQRVNTSGTALFAAGGATLVGSGAEVSGVTLAADGAGGVIAGYVSSQSSRLTLQRSTPSGIPMWPGSGVALMFATSGAPETRTFDVISDGAGGAFCGAAGLVQHVNASGVAQWGTPLTGAPVGIGEVVTCRLAADGAGGVACVWIANEITGPMSLRMQRLDASGTKLWSSAGKAIVRDTHVKNRIFRFTRDGNGGFVAAWWEDRVEEQFGSVAFRIFVQRVNGAGQQQWTAGGVAVSTTESEQALATMTDDGAGGVILSWTEELASFPGESAFAQHLAFGGLTDEYIPHVASVSDIPADEGGLLRISLSTVAAEALSLTPQPTSFGLWRLIPAAAVTAAARAEQVPRDGDGTVDAAALFERANRERVVIGPSIAAAIGFPAGDWESIGSHPATQSGSYTFVVSTMADSGATGPADETCVVTIHTGVASMYAVSPAVTGHSVDNLAPAAPALFAVVYGGASNALHWGASVASDFAQFHVHRGATSSFVPGPGNLVAATPDTHLVDTGGGAAFYKIAAVDRHGNVGPFTLGNSPTTDVGPGDATLELALTVIGSNPARGNATFSFTLPTEGRATLDVLDVQGRLVRQLVHDPRSAGQQQVVWSGDDQHGQRARAGMYFARLGFKGSARVLRLVLVP